MAKDKKDTVPSIAMEQLTAQPKTPVKYAQEELLKVFDEMIFNGEYTEESTIRGKLKVSYRSRTAEETMEISKALDAMDFKLLTTMQEQRAILNLSKSLLSYQGRDLLKASSEERLKFIKNLPVPIVGALADSLAEFDRKIDLACREAEENF